VVDTHCHMDACSVPDGALVEAARQAGINRIATVGTDPESIERAIFFSRTYPEVAAIVGRHPHAAEGFCDSDVGPIERAAASGGVVAIGECGLDYYRDNASRQDQRRAFCTQIDIAARMGLPVVIHTRAADEDTFAILRERATELCVVMHCFSSPSRADECVERGYFCSFAGNLTFPKATDLQEVATQLPEQLLLVETDSPYLAPQPVRGKPNEPKNVVTTASFLADLRGATYAHIERVVEENAAGVFGW
jgi:TatD DNase family protein